MEQPEIRIGFSAKRHFEQMPGVVREPVNIGKPALQPARQEVDGERKAVHLCEQRHQKCAERAPVTAGARLKEAKFPRQRAIFFFVRGLSGIERFAGRGYLWLGDAISRRLDGPADRIKIDFFRLAFDIDRVRSKLARAETIPSVVCSASSILSVQELQCMFLMGMEAVAVPTL